MKPFWGSAPSNGGTRLYPDGLTYLEGAEEDYRIRQDHPESSRARTRPRVELSKRNWSTLTETESEITSDATTFYVTNRVRARTTVEGVRREVFSREYRETVSRTSA